MDNLFSGKNVIIQGITGNQGRFHTRAMQTAGTHIVAGTSPGKAGETVESVPVYNSIRDIQADTTVDISVIFVPAPFAKKAIIEAIDTHVPLIVCITEGIPVHDMLEVNERLARSAFSTLLGPNSPGVLLPSVQRLGIIPHDLSLPGSVAIASRSGTLTYEIMADLSARQVGQAYVVGIGGDMIHGIGYKACLVMFEADPAVDRIVLIGEIGGQEEIEAALFIKNQITKPVFAYIAGNHAPTGVQLGHAGAILGSEHESAAAKTNVLKLAGVTVAATISELAKKVAAHEVNTQTD